METGKAGSKAHILENITQKETYSLIKKNIGNPDFVILDVRAPEEFMAGHLKSALNLDYYSKSFRNDLNKINRGEGVSNLLSVSKAEWRSPGNDEGTQFHGGL